MLAPYRAAKINWRQAEGESISVAVIPASYFENLLALLPQFEALTGVKVRPEKVPPGQIRQKAMLDLSSKTGTYATSATDPIRPRVRTIGVNLLRAPAAPASPPVTARGPIAGT